MISESYKRERDRKPSEIEWLGPIPKEWQLLRGKFVFKEINERSSTGDETLLSVSEYYGVKPRREAIANDEHLSRSESLIGYKKCRKNDLAMNIMLAWKRGLGISKYDGIVSPAYSVFRFGKCANPDFMHYLLRTDEYVDHFKARSTGVIDSRLRLYPDVFADIQILLPSVSEQIQIAEFLDYETTKIDALIAKQKQLIALLEEKHHAVISHVVTKGLNPRAPMRSSDIESLGDIPAHWVITKVKFAYENLDSTRIPLSTLERAEMQGPFPYYGASGVIDFVDNFLFDEPLVLVSEDGANLLARSTPISFTATGKYWVNNHAHILKPMDQNIEFWAEAIENNDLAPFVTGSAQPKFTSEALSNLLVTYPKDASERALLNKFIIDQKHTFNYTLTKVRSAITLLKERRITLISAAVTGKVDVRDWTPPDAKDKAA